MQHIVQFSHSVVSNSLRPHELQCARPPCPSPTPRTYPNSCPLSRWCHPTISSSVVPLSPCPQSFPASGCFQMSHPAYWWVPKNIIGPTSCASWVWRVRKPLPMLPWACFLSVGILPLHLAICSRTLLLNRWYIWSSQKACRPIFKIQQFF